MAKEIKLKQSKYGNLKLKKIEGTISCKRELVANRNTNKVKNLQSKWQLIKQINNFFLFVSLPWFNSPDIWMKLNNISRFRDPLRAGQVLDPGLSRLTRSLDWIFLPNRFSSGKERFRQIVFRFARTRFCAAKSKASNWECLSAKCFQPHFRI